MKNQEYILLNDFHILKSKKHLQTILSQSDDLVEDYYSLVLSKWSYWVFRTPHN